MKKILSVLPVYLGAFVVTTFALIYLNGIYRNIFAFDFTPIGVKTIIKVPRIQRIDKDKLQNYLLHKIKPDLQKELKKFKPKVIVDTVKKVELQDRALIDSLKALRKEIAAMQKFIVTMSRRSLQQKTITKTSKKVDEREIKLAAKLLQSMSPPNAAKVLLNYKPKDARKILQNMSPKKAAKVLELLKPQLVSKIMSF